MTAALRVELERCALGALPVEVLERCLMKGLTGLLWSLWALSLLAAML